MKLYLTSYRIPTPDDLKKLIGKEFGDVKVAAIANAKDYLGERARSVKVNDAIADLKTVGFKHIDEIDLRKVTDKKTLRSNLKNYDLVWAMGGNTFCLMHEVKRSGFDLIIKDLLEKGIVYGGESAGAVAAGNSLKGVELEDNPKFSETVIWDGMKLVDKYILPHADSLVFAEGIEETRKMHASNPTLIELKDSEALVINGSEIKKVSAKL